MELKLLSLKVENFKGIRAFEIQPNGNNLKVKGKNERGKTSLYDAFLWLLFGKNSAGETKFGVKPNNSPDGIEPTVTAIFSVDGRELELKKVLAAKFAKDTGEFKESKVECYINGVKKAPKEYENYISSEICNEMKFKLLTNPRQFCENLEWKERRKILFDVCGQLTDTDIIKLDITFEPLEEMLLKYGSIDEYRAFLISEKKNISQQINDIPIRIDEVFKQIDKSLDLKTLTASLDEISSKIETLKNERTALQNGTSNIAIAEKISEIKQQIYTLENENKTFQNNQSLDFTTAKIQKRSDVKEKASDVQSKIREIKYKIETLMTTLKSFSDERQKALNTYADLQKKEWDGFAECPTCGQAIPEEKLKASKENFNEQKSKDIETNVAYGKELAEQIKKFSSECEKYRTSLTPLENQLQEFERELTEIDTVQIEVTDIEGYSEKSTALNAQIKALESEQAKANESTLPQIASLTEQINSLTVESTNIQSQIAKCKQNEVLEKRLDELKSEQKSLVAKQGNNLKMLDIVDSFTRRKVSLIEESVNDKFKIAKFKLFNENVTDGKINECCDVIANNAPNYSDINTAGKVIAGFDIINTLSLHYNFTAPLFVDNLDSLDSENKEKVIKVAGENAQVITLMVSDDEVLTVEG